MDVPSRWLLFHGVVVLLVGLLAGIPYGVAINRRKPEMTVNQWRLAHGSLSLGGTTMLAVAAVLSHLAVGAGVRWSIAASFALSGYGFSFALPLAAWVGQRGLAWEKPAANRVVYAGNSLGAWASLVGTLALLYAAYTSL